MKSFLKILIVTGLLGLEAACISPSGGPATVESPPNAGPGDNFTNTGIVPPGGGQAAPSWTASSSGSVGCLAGGFFAHVSLSDQGPMDPHALSFTVTAKGIDQEGYAPLADHGLTILNIQIRDLKGALLVTSSGVSLNPNPGLNPENSSSLRGLPTAPSAPIHPTELNVWINLWSPDNRLPCEQFWSEVLLQKNFSLRGAYPGLPQEYEKAQEALSLTPPGQGTTSIDPFVLVKKE